MLIDGSSYLYRAFHALPPLTNMQGEPTGAVYGVISMIKKLITDYDPEHVAVIFDPKGKTTRDEIYSEYKAHRPAMPTDLSIQIAHIYDIIEALGLPILVYDGIEADDVIGALAVKATEQGFKTLVSTGDKDMTQLVNSDVTLINTMTGMIYDREGVIKKFGLPPERIVDYLALIGDKVDNIPGVPNVGPKTAVKWLTEYGSLESIIEHSNEIKGKVGDNLRDHLEQLPLAKQLVTIYTDLDLPITINEINRKTPNKPALINFYRHLEFKTWLSELLEEDIVDTHEHYEVILSEESLMAVLKKLDKCEIFALDIETSHPDAMQADLVGIGIATAPKKAWYIPFVHDYENVPTQLDRLSVLSKLKPLLCDSNKTLIGENLKYVLNVLLRNNIEVRNQLIDTMLESYIQNSATARHDKNTLSLKYLGRRTLSYEEVVGKGAKQVPCSQIDIEKVTQYAAESADIAFQLHHLMNKKISKDKALNKILFELEMPLTKVLARMEYNGVLIDNHMLNNLSVELAKRLETLEDQAYTLAGAKFNLGSPKQLQVILYEKLNLPVTSKTPTGQPSTSEGVLQDLARDYELPRIILEHRSLSKIKSTYSDRLPLQVNKNTGRVHTCYNQAVTATGRLSSTDPNLQNIPIRNEEGRRIRQAFIAPKGHKIVSADYSQIELRIMAHITKDPGLLRAFENDLDIHTATAAEIFNLTIEEVSPQQRRSAKTINFGLIYGMSPFGLSNALGIERNLAQDYITRYFERYPAIQNYMNSIRQIAHEQGYVETLWQRRIYLPEINATNLQRQKGAERAAINAPLQGTAAEIIKLAMINIDRWLQESKLKTKMVMQVHDELVFEVPEDELDNVKENIRNFMVNTIELDIPLAVDIGEGDNWDQAH